MGRGQSFEDFLDEEIGEDPELAEELGEAFDDMRLAVQLALCRERAGLSQQALSIKSGVSQPMISRIETGEQQPTWPTIRRLISALGAEVLLMPTGEVEVRATAKEHTSTNMQTAVG